MLVLEIAAGVFIGLFVFWKFYKHHTKKEEDKVAQIKIYEANSERIRRRIDAAFADFINIFAERLLTLEDDKTITFQDAGIIELKLFMEHLIKIQEQIEGDEDVNREALQIDANLKQRILFELNEGLASMSTKANLQALSMFEEKILEIANSKVS
jgi:hypothetical protein